MCENTIKKSETTIKRDVDEWIDGEGNFHRRVTEETITSPMDLNQATFPRIRGVFRPIKNRHGRFIPMPGAGPKFLNSIQSMDFPEPKQFFGNNMSDKPLIDIKKIMEQGKMLLKASGMKLEDLFKQPSGVQVSAEELVKETKEEPEEDKVTLNRPRFEKEDNLNQKKEVNKWQKKQKPQKKQKKQNQKKKQKKKN